MPQRGKFLFSRRSAYPTPACREAKCLGYLLGVSPLLLFAVGRVTSVCCQSFQFDLQRPLWAFALCSRRMRVKLARCLGGGAP